MPRFPVTQAPTASSTAGPAVAELESILADSSQELPGDPDVNSIIQTRRACACPEDAFAMLGNVLSSSMCAL
eukprot:11158688-Lingulodinium_polyedra.AAC.1